MDEPPQIDPDASDEERAEQLKQAAKEHRQELNSEQQDILESISEEHGGDIIETTFSVTPDHTATIKAKFGGRLTDRLGAIEDRLNQWEEYNPETDPRSEAPPVSDIGRTADEISEILADMIDSEDYDKELFYSVYEQEDLEALGEILRNAIDAVEQEKKRQQGAVDGFRQE